MLTHSVKSRYHFSLHRPSRHGTQFLVKWRDLPYDKATWEDIGEDFPVKGAYEAVKNFEKIK